MKSFIIKQRDDLRKSIELSDFKLLDIKPRGYERGTVLTLRPRFALEHRGLILVVRGLMANRSKCFFNELKYLGIFTKFLLAVHIFFSRTFSRKHTRIDERGSGMIQLDFRRKKNGVPILSKKDIEDIAEVIIQDYKPKILDEPCSLDIELFSESYTELEMDYQDLTHAQSILGMVVFNDCRIPVYDAEKEKAKRIMVHEGTILIDNSLL